MINFQTFLLISLAIKLSTALYYPQYFLAYPYKSCIGMSDHYWLDTNTNIFDNLNGILYKSIIVQGLWRVNFNDKEIFTEVSLNSANPCTILTPDNDGNYVPLKSVVKLAAGDLDDSFISLYPLRLFDGEPVTVNDQGKDNVEKQGFVLESWALTGGKPFTIYDGDYFTGNSICILPDDDATGEEGGISVGTDVEDKLVVRSVKLGCDSKTKNIIRGGMQKATKEKKTFIIQGSSKFITHESVPRIIEIY